MRLLPGIILWPKPQSRTGCPFSLFCLAPQGVCPATAVTRSAVSFYLAISPLPVLRATSHEEQPPSHFEEGLLFVARRAKNGRYIFCDTIRHPAITTRRPGFHRACCRVVSGLSSETRGPQRSSPVCFVRNINGIHFRAREEFPCERRLPPQIFHPPSNSAPLFHAIVIPTTKKASTESSNKISQSLPGFSAGSIVR